MTSKTKPAFFKRALGWLLLIGITAAAFAVVAVPVWLIQPFAAQTENEVATSFWLKSWSPVLTVLAAVFGGATAIWLVLNSKRWWSRTFVILPLALIAFSVWFAQQNHFEWMFNPLANSAYAKTAETDFVADDDMVLAVANNNDSVAYPVRLMAYHHIVEDAIGGVPIAATY